MLKQKKLLLTDISIQTGWEADRITEKRTMNKKDHKKRGPGRVYL